MTFLRAKLRCVLLCCVCGHRQMLRRVLSEPLVARCCGLLHWHLLLHVLLLLLLLCLLLCLLLVLLLERTLLLKGALLL